MKLKIIIILALICVIGSNSFGQNLYQIKFFDGWSVVETVALDSGLILFSLISTRDRSIPDHGTIRITKVDYNLEIIKQTSYSHPGSYLTEIEYPFSVKKLSNEIVASYYWLDTISGHFKQGLVSIDFDLDVNWISEDKRFNNLTSPSINFIGDTAYLINQITEDNYQGLNKNVITQYYRDTFIGVSDTINCFSEHKVSPKANCNITPKNSYVNKDDKIIFSYETRNATIGYLELQNAGVLMFDPRADTTVWRISFKNNITTYDHFLIFPGKNNTTIAVWFDCYFYPFKSPSNRMWPSHNLQKSNFFARIDEHGKIIEEWVLKDELTGKFKFSDRVLKHNHFISEKNQTYLTGLVLDTGHNSYLLSLDSNAQFKWFRQYGVGISNPWWDGYEKLLLKSVTRMQNGGFALAGQYYSPPSDTFPNGINKSILITVDQYGCFKQNCQLKDNIEQFISPLEFKIYPNPVYDQFVIETNLHPQRIILEIHSVDGTMQMSTEFIGTKYKVDISTLPSAFYFVRVLNEKREYLGSKKLFIK